MIRPSYRLIDHTADMAYEVEGASFEHLLETATAALADIVLDCEHATLDESRELVVGGADREDVLVAWLNEVVILFEDDAFLAREAEFDQLSDTGARGRLRGRTIDFDSEPADRVINAVTYHDLEVVAGESGNPWRATIVLDL